jgi:ParB family chromosome partitioning protein
MKLRNMLVDAGESFLTRPATAATPTEAVQNVLRIPVELVDPDPENARTVFDAAELAALADDMKRHGQLQNAVVFPGAGRFTLVAGERRWRACKLAGINTLTCLVLPRDVALEVRHEMAFAENMCRSDLKPTEVAKRWRALIDRWGVTGVELARRIGVSNTTVSKKLALLKLDAGTQAAIDAGHVGEECARRQANASAPSGRGRYAGKRRGRANRNVLELATGTVRLKRGRTWAALLEELRAAVEAEHREAA